MSFGAPQWLWGLLLIPALITLFIRAERRGTIRLREFVSARLLPQLAGSVNRPRRVLRFALQLAGLALALISLAQPRWGYTFEDVKRKGLDLLIAVDTSRSMLSNDVQPNRLERVKLAARDLINELQGDRVGLIAFAGRAFLQAPREIAQAAGGFYLHLENGPRTMQQIYTEGLAKMQAAEMDVRLSRRPIERYEWPLGVALIALALSIFTGERKRTRERVFVRVPVKIATAASALWIVFCQFAFAAAPGRDAYREGKFDDAYTQLKQTLKTNPHSQSEDKLHFDSGAAAYKSEEYGKALESFSQALLSPDTGLQGKSHYNLGNTLYERGETQKSDDKKLRDWTNALEHYEQTLKLEPKNKEAKDNYDYVKKKIEELKNKKQPQQHPSPSPSPSPQQKNKQRQQNQQNQQSQQDQQKQEQQQQQQQQQSQSQQQQKDGQQQSQNQQSQNESGHGQDQNEEKKKKDQSQAKNEPQQSKQQQGGQPSPSPSGGEKKQNQEQSGEGEQPSPAPGDHGNDMPSPSPSPGSGEGAEENPTPSAAPTESPQKKLDGEVKGAGKDESKKAPDENSQVAEAEAEKEDQMTERQAESLLQSMKDEEARVQLDERRAARHVYNDW